MVEASSPEDHSAGGADQSPRQWSFDSLVWVFIAALWMGAVYALITVAPVRFPDSPGYVGDPRQLEGFFSLTGDALRAWPTVLVFWLADNDFSRAALQSLLYATAWSALLITWLNHRTRIHVGIIGGLLTTLALSPLALQWNMTILAESITISLVVAGIASLRPAFDAVTTRSWGPYAWFAAGTALISLAAVNRAALIALMIAPATVLTLLWRERPRRLAPLGAALLVFVGALVYPLVYNEMTNTHWSSDGARPSRSSLNFLLLSSVGAPQPTWADALWQDISDAAPDCLRDHRGSFLEGGPSPLVQADELAAQCPGGVAWLNDSFTGAYAAFIVANPQSTIRYVSAMVSSVAAPVAYARVNLPLPRALQTLFEGDSSANAGFQPIVGWLMSSAILLGAVLIRRTPWSRPLILALAVLLGGLASLVTTVIMIMTESVRTSSPATIAVLIGCLLLLGEGCRCLRRRAPSSQASGRSPRSSDDSVG